MERIRSGRPFEARIGFSRAVVAGDLVAVSGCGPSNPDGSTAGGNDPYAQALACCRVIRDALAAAGANLTDVYRTRMYLTRRDDWEAVGRAHAEVFGAHPPASTMVVVAELLVPEWLVEIEAEARLHS